MKIETQQVAAPLMITITEEANIVRPALDQLWDKVKGDIEIDGFRKGHADRKAAEKAIGASRLYADYFDELLFRVKTEHNIPVVAIQNYHLEQMADTLDPKDNTPIVISIIADIEPEVTLTPALDSIEVKAPSIVIADADIDKALKYLSEHQAEHVVLNDDAIIKVGDYVEYSATILSKPTAFARIIDDPKDPIIGMKPNELKNGILVKKVEAIKVPEIDDAFAKKNHFDTLVEFREGTRKQLVQDKQDARDAQIRTQIITYLIEHSPIAPIPSSMIKQQIDVMFTHVLATVGMTEEQYLKQSKVTKADIQEQFARSAIHNIKARLLLKAVAKATNIVAEDKEVQAQIDDILKQTTHDRKEVEYALSARIKDDILSKKVLDLLTTKCKIIEQ